MQKGCFKILFFSLLWLGGKAQDANLLPLAINVSDQSPKSGVYLTYSDYTKNKLSYEADCKKEKQTIKLNEFLNESFITVKKKKEKIKLQKDSIYGILNCDEPLLIFQDKVHYSLAEKGSVWIFYREVSIPQAKTFKLEKRYYFSTKGDGKLEELTINNIKRAFPDNHKLHDLIDVHFQNRDLSEYDIFHKMFKINHLINDSKTDLVCPDHADVRGKEGELCPKCGKKLGKL